MRLALALALVALVALSRAVTVSAMPPYGNRAYTYQTTPSGILASFNGAAPSSGIEIVNAYGGWFTRSSTRNHIICVSTTTPTAPSPRRFLVNNTETMHVDIIACAADSCKHDEYVHCSGSLPPGSVSVVTMDANIHFMIMLYNATTTQECWPKSYGTFPNLQLPLSPTACAQIPTGPNPSLPGPHDSVVRLQPGHDTQHSASDVDAFASVPGVKEITLVFDGRMDLCDEYDQYNMSNRDRFPCGSAPDLRNITEARLDALATDVARVACGNAHVSSVQVDLEPLKNPWEASTIKALGKMATALSSPLCIDAAHPNGRYISSFLFAEDVTAELLNALGENGFLAVSGYDLYPDDFPDDNRFNTPIEYKSKLQKQVEAVLEITGGVKGAACKIPWVLGLPVAASAHEYKTYIPNPEHCGPACIKYVNPDNQTAYINAAFDYVKTRPDVFSQGPTGCFRGFAFWKFDSVALPKSGAGDYPPHSGNRWSPLGPGPVDLNVLKENLQAIRN
jgi:hypothetical protein